MALLATVAAPASAEAPVTVGSRMILPPLQPRPEGTTLVVKPGDMVGEAQPGWSEVAVLDKDVVVTVGKSKASLRAGTVLVRSAYAGEGPDLLPPGSTVYCGQTNYAVLRAAGLFTLLAAAHEINASPVFYDPTLCLADTDGDGALDVALRLKGTKAPLIEKQTPISFERKARFPIPGESRVAVRYKGSGANGEAWFGLSFVNEGHEESFLEMHLENSNGGVDTLRPSFGVPANGTPQEVAGMKLSVLGIDKSNGQASIRIDEDFSEAHFGLTVERIMLIYVPH